MAYIVMAYAVMAYTVMAHIVMAYIVMAHTVAYTRAQIRKRTCTPQKFVPERAQTAPVSASVQTWAQGVGKGMCTFMGTGRG